MELTGNAVRHVYSCYPACSDRWKEYCIGGQMETGELTSIIVYALQIIGALMMVTFVFVMIMIAEASTDRITEVLEEVPEMQDKADAVKDSRKWRDYFSIM